MKSLPYNYFAARLLGWNGSHSRVIAQASGCWDTEEQANDELDSAIWKARDQWCDANGIAYDDETAQDRTRGWLSDYQRTSVEFDVTPTVDGRLAHNLSETINLGSLPSFA